MLSIVCVCWQSGNRFHTSMPSCYSVFIPNHKQSHSLQYDGLVKRYLYIESGPWSRKTESRDVGIVFIDYIKGCLSRWDNGRRWLKLPSSVVPPCLWQPMTLPVTVTLATEHRFYLHNLQHTLRSEKWPLFSGRFLIMHNNMYIIFKCIFLISNFDSDFPEFVQLVIR